MYRYTLYMVGYKKTKLAMAADHTFFGNCLIYWHCLGILFVSVLIGISWIINNLSTIAELLDLDMQPRTIRKVQHKISTLIKEGE